MAMIALAAATVAFEIGVRLLTRPRVSTASPVIGDISTSANGSPIPFGYGTVRVAGQIIWSAGITFTTKPASKWKGTPQTYSYFCSFAVAFGEGPMCITRIWADTKLIYVAPGTITSEYPVQDFPPYVPGQLYNPGNVVGYQGQVYQALTVSTSVTPGTDPTKWLLVSDYPPWSDSFDYNAGDVASYAGTLWVAQASNIDFTPGAGDTTTVNEETVPYWIPLAQAYPAPTIYAGDEDQMPDPTIQAFEGAANTPGYRGIGYAVYENLPLIMFGNRLANVRAEVTYLKVPNVL